MKRIGLVLVVALAALVAVPTAMAAEASSLFGDARLVSPGNDSTHAVQVRSGVSPGWGVIDFVIPAGTTFADLATLSTDYMFEADDSCGVGSPRFQINVDDPVSGTTKNINVYIGPPSNYDTCPSDVWISTGNLLSDGNTVDTQQLGGPFVDTYATALANYGSYTVTGVQFVIDAGWSFLDGEQTVLVDNTNVAGVVYTYETTSDLAGQLHADTVELVDHATAERTLLATLDAAETYIDAERPLFARATITRYIFQVQIFEIFGMISPEAADQLTAQAQQFLSSFD